MGGSCRVNRRKTRGKKIYYFMWKSLRDDGLNWDSHSCILDLMWKMTVMWGKILEQNITEYRYTGHFNMYRPWVSSNFFTMRTL